MLCGQYTPSEDVFTECMGREVLIKTPERYSGLLTAKFYDTNGEEIQYVKTYFEQIAIMTGKYFSTHTSYIETVIRKYCKKHIKPYCTDEMFHGYEIDGNALIRFTTEKPISTPDISFKIDNQTYTIKLVYSPEEPLEGETYEYD